MEKIVYVTKKVGFNAAHRLHNRLMSNEENLRVFGKCNNDHGHNYVLEVTVRGNVDSKTGMVINLTALKTIMMDLVATMDHKHIDRDCQYFVENCLPSTAENISIFFFDAIKQKLDDPSSLYSVRIHETADNIAEYRG